jgi:hypothetical protein
VVVVFRRRSFLEEVVVVFRRRSFLEEAVEEVEVVVPFPPQEAVEAVEEVEVEVLRLQDLLEEVSVQSFCAPN